MSMLKLVYKKPKKIYYNCLINGRKVNLKKLQQLKSLDGFCLVERNFFLQNNVIMFLFIIFTIIAGFFGGFIDDFKDIRLKRKIIELRIGEINSSIIKIHIDSLGDVTAIEGVSDFNILSSIEEDHSEAAKRIKFYRRLTLGFFLIWLAVIAVIIIYLIIKEKIL